MEATTKSTHRILNPTRFLLSGSSSSSSPILFYLSSLFCFFVASQSQPTGGPIPPTASPTTLASSANPPTPPLKPHQSQSNLKFVLPLTFAVALFFVTLLLVMGCFAFRRFKNRRCCRPSGEQGVFDSVDDEKQLARDGGDVGSVRRFGWEEIERVTMNFSKVIGSGGFSTVYLAHFSGSRSPGAIKIHNGSERLNRVFKQELDILLRLHHRNIVKLLGYCDEREEGALVFEYVPNGTLQEMLHGDCETTKLSWRTRMAIAFQLAQAMEYLHEKCTLQIVHGDIKASNILLDEQLSIKLCDFGFAKMGFSSTILPPSTSSMKHVMMGSPGYTDPHYLRTGIASKKNDVYSFGVIILELVTGMEAFSSGQLLTSIAGPKLSLESELEATMVAEMVDPRLGGEFDVEEAKAMLSISAQCLRQAHTLRPSATQILQTMSEKIHSVTFLSPEKDSRLALSLPN